uniref:Uncharacterized protein n=1 Tax=viral metagenome TaxID=1070528 RepID=A0A6C0KW44_9ZZZZ
MAKNRKNNRSRKHRSRRHRGGNALHGASLAHSLAGSWPSRMSLGQGGDYFKYHQGQHGGAVFQGAPLSAIADSSLPDALRGPAHIGGLDKAFVDIRGLKDQTGGRRTRHHKKRHHKNRSRRNKSHRHKSRRNKSNKSKSRRNRRSRRNNRRSGGALGYAPFPASSGMLLDKMGYQQAGLNPEWKSDISFSMAKIRDSQ